MSEQNNETPRPDEDAVVAPEADEHLTAGEKFTPEKLGEAALKFAAETVYAAAGVADMIAAKARELYEIQRAQIAEKTPEGVDPNFRKMVDSMPDQFKGFLDEATKAYHEMAERGRHAVADLQNQVAAARDAKPEKPEPVGVFDLNDDAGADAEAADAVAPEEPVVDEPVEDAAEAAPETAPEASGAPEDGEQR
ncbi:MAG: hypothetical protein QM708_06085 [Propioniciclava sp.]|uniref:hypothetical protein n=1 Tax=Propioniciclava sp. TaxID=2038686 RepID=UPI0039E52FED